MRIWHGYTTPGYADPYESLLKREIFREIESEMIARFRKIQLLRRPMEEEVEFITDMWWFDSLDEVKQLAGQNYEKAVVLEEV